MPFDEVLTAAMKRNDNGERGEARTRALLLDRFWVLTRSIDTDGADFLIQKRTAESLTHWGSSERPSIGRVQAKWIQDFRTDIHLDPQHIEDESGAPWPEYWLMLHSDMTPRSDVRIISAEQIARAYEKKSTTEARTMPNYSIGCRERNYFQRPTWWAPMISTKN